MDVLEFENPVAAESDPPPYETIAQHPASTAPPYYLLPGYQQQQTEKTTEKQTEKTTEKQTEKTTENLPYAASCPQPPQASRWPSPSLPDYLREPTGEQSYSGPGFYPGKMQNVTVQPHSEVRNPYPQMRSSFTEARKPCAENECLDECVFWARCCEVCCYLCLCCCEIASHMQ